MRALPSAGVALMVSVLASACGAVTSNPLDEARGPVTQILPNGTRLIVEPRTDGEVVAVQLWVRAGARDEGQAELGLAHYLEHMLFKGTPTRPPGFIDREVEGIGGRMNASTSLDYTYYRILVPPGRAAAAVEMLADIAVNASLDETQLEREKRVVLEEMRLGEDSATRSLMRNLYTAVFDGHPYGRPVIGRAQVIQELTRPQLLAFYRRHYVPSAFTLVVVGPVQPAEILAAAEQALGRIPRGDDERLPTPAPPAMTDRHTEIEWPGRYAYLALGWIGPKLDHADTPALDLLVSVLGRGRSSRVVLEIRDRLGLATSIEAGQAALESASLIWVSAQVEPLALGRVEAEVRHQIMRIRADGVTESERERALTTAEARREFESESVDGRAHALGQAQTVWRLEEQRAYLDRLRGVTRPQITAVARRYLDPDHYARVVLQPRGAR